jgi:hypothetical protein
MKISWGTSITIIYTAFALATLGFVGFAMTQRVDLVSADYYGEALQHDQMQRARAVAHQRDIAVYVTRGRIWLSNMTPADSGTADLSFKRAQDPAMDRTYRASLSTLASDGVSMRQLEHGRWDVRVTWNQGREAFQIDTVIVL